MKTLLFMLALVYLSGCSSSGHSPSYIISDATSDIIRSERCSEKEL